MLVEDWLRYDPSREAVLKTGDELSCWAYQLAGLLQMGIRSLMKAVTLALLAGGLLAQTGVQSKQAAGECESATTTAAMRTCENARYQAAQRELSEAYESLMKRLDNGQREKLRLAQQAWVRFRDADADFQASTAEGGTLAPLIKISALANMTGTRAVDLRKQLP